MLFFLAFCASLAWVVNWLFRFWKRDIRGKAVFITGCDRGFGRSLVLAFADYGCQVFAGCLTKEAVQELQELNKRKGGLIHALQVDVTNNAHVQKAVEAVENSGLQLAAVINNAAITSFGFVEQIRIETYQKIADVNLFGTIRVSKAFLPLLRKAQGRILMMGSIGPRMNSAFGSAYLCSKAAMMSFASCLAQEEYITGVKVCLLEPGFFSSSLRDVGSQAGSKEANIAGEFEIYPAFKKKMAEVGETIKQIEDLNGSDKWVCYAMVRAASERFPPYCILVGYDAYLLWLASKIVPHRLLEMVAGYL